MQRYWPNSVVILFTGTVIGKRQILLAATLFLLIPCSFIPSYSQGSALDGLFIIDTCLGNTSSDVYYEVATLDTSKDVLLVKQYWAETGTLREETQCRQYDSCSFIANGDFKAYSRSGNLWLTSHYIEGIKSGKEIQYYENGDLKAHHTFERGERNGYFIEYYPNGYASRNGKYLNGIKAGRWITFYPNRNTKSKGHYSSERKTYTLSDDMDSVFIYSDEMELVDKGVMDSTVFTVLKLQVGQVPFVGLRFPLTIIPKDGVWEFWDQDGQKTRIEHWENGNLIEVEQLRQ